MGCGGSNADREIQMPQPQDKLPGATSSSASPLAAAYSQEADMSTFESIADTSLPVIFDREEASLGSTGLRTTAGPPAATSPRHANDEGPSPPPPMAPRPFAVTPPMAARPPSAAARDAVRPPSASSRVSDGKNPFQNSVARSLSWPPPSSPAWTLPSGCLDDYAESAAGSLTLTGFNSPRPFDEREPVFRPHSANLSTASSTPRRFPPVSPSRGIRNPADEFLSPSSPGLRSTAEEDILDLFDENDEREDQDVRREVQGFMSNIHVELMGGSTSPWSPGGTRKVPSRRNPNNSLSLSAEEERLMQEILEDEVLSQD